MNDIISFKQEKQKQALDIIVIAHDGSLCDIAKDVDQRANGLVTRHIQQCINDKKFNHTQILSFQHDGAFHDVMVVLMGKITTPIDSEKIGASIHQHLSGSHFKEGNLLIDDIDKSHALSIIFGILLQSYRFLQFITKQQSDDGDGDNDSKTCQYHIISHDNNIAQEFNESAAIASGVFFARDLVSLPPNVLYPATFADQCRAMRDLGVEIEIMGESQLHEIGMNALLGVGQGSTKESHVVIMKWHGGDAQQPPLALIGKGVTFDSGGISLKPGAGMQEMKWDMGGAGAVAGAMWALAARKAKANVIGVLGLVENMPDGGAQRPGDIVTSLSGQTIEIHNTDAEGRLVLADLLWYVKQQYQPSYMVNLATLTGAIIAALGNEYAGLFANDDELADMLRNAGEDVNERLWAMPMDKSYDKALNTLGADMKNIGGRYGGSIIAAKFLQRFVDDCKWAHLDIAGVAWDSKGKPTIPAGATGYGVRLLDQLVRLYFEEK